MTAIVKPEAVELAVRRAEQCRADIETELRRAVDQENNLGRSYVRIGLLLLEMKEKEHWRMLSYSNFEHLMQEMSERFNKGRTMLYSYVSVVESLYPQIGRDNLEQMGESKARVLKQAMKAADGKPVPKGLLTDALDPKVTAEKLRTKAYEAYHVEPQEQGKGTWTDLGFYATLDEREILKRAFRTAERMDPVIEKDMPDHMRRRECVLRWALEYLATYEAAVNRGEA